MWFCCVLCLCVCASVRYQRAKKWKKYNATVALYCTEIFELWRRNQHFKTNISTYTFNNPISGTVCHTSTYLNTHIFQVIFFPGCRRTQYSFNRRTFQHTVSRQTFRHTNYQHPHFNLISTHTFQNQKHQLKIKNPKQTITHAKKEKKKKPSTPITEELTAMTTIRRNFLMRNKFSFFKIISV